MGYIDFGIVGELDEDLSTMQERIVFHLVRGEVHSAYQMLVTSLELYEQRDLAEFELIVKAGFSDYLLRMRSPHATAAEKSTGRVFIAVASAIRKMGLGLPARLTRFYRAQLITDMLVFTLDPALDVVAECTQFWRRRGRQRRLRASAWGRASISRKSRA